MADRGRGLVALAAAALLLSLGCTAVNRLLTGSGGDPAARYGVDRDEALILSGSQPQTLDPATTHAGAAGPIGAIFSGLVRLNTDLQVEPELAAGWRLDEGGTRFTFYLRPDAHFHDGRPVTAADVTFSWERAADPATGSDTALTYLGDIVGVPEKLSGTADHIAGLRVVDAQTLEVTIAAPRPYFLAKLTYPAAFVVDRENVALTDWEKRPNGTGPFTLEAWRDDEVLILARNDAYYGRPARLAHVVYVIGAGIPLALYEQGEIDMVGLGGADLERARDPNSPLHDELRLGVAMCTSTVTFDVRRPPFDDPRVRRAFAYAVDRQRLIDGLYLGSALPADGPLPPGLPGYTGDVERHPFDPAAARALLAEAGYADPGTLPPLTYTTAGYGSPGALVTALITMWQDNLGVAIEPVLLDPFNYLDELFAGRTGNLFGHGWCADYPDPANFLDVLYRTGSPQNLGGYSNPAADALLAQAAVEPDPATRLALYAHIERLIVADAPAVFLSHSLTAELVSPAVKNYTLTPIGVAQLDRIAVERP